MKLILLGAPGSGKGTQAVKIAERYHVAHISTGDIFRDNIKNMTELGKKVKEMMDNGRLCPDDVTCALVQDRISQPDCKNGYLLDGFPRNLFQASELDKFAMPDKVINLDVDLGLIEKRITGRRSCPVCGGSFHIDFIGNVSKCPTCGGELVIRKDDNEQTVKERLAIYQSQTQPLIEYYSKQGKVFNVDGNMSIDEVFTEIVKVLG